MVEGRRVTGVCRMGKRIVIALQGELFVLFHLMVAGWLRWRRQGAIRCVRNLARSLHSGLWVNTRLGHARTRKDMLLPVEFFIVVAATLIFVGFLRLYASHRRAEIESKQVITIPPKRRERRLRKRRLRTDRRSCIRLDADRRQNGGRRGSDRWEGSRARF